MDAVRIAFLQAHQRTHQTNVSWSLVDSISTIYEVWVGAKNKSFEFDAFDSLFHR